MPLTEIKKAKPVSMKSSGTDDPSKYVGGWESYDKPQGINARRDRKVLAKEDAETDPNLWNGKSSVWTNGQYHIVVDTPGNAKYISVWTQDNTRVGYLETRTIPGYKDWLAIGDVGLLKDHRGKRLGIQMYRVLIQEMAPKYKGIAGYLPDTINKREVPAIYRRLGGKLDPENADVMLVPRGNLVEADAYGPNGMTRFAPEVEIPALDVGQVEQDAIKKSKRPAMSVVRASARALSARGKPPRLNPYKLDETIRTPVLGSLTAAYEIVDDNEAVVGAAEVQSGVIQRLDIDTTADEAYRGQIISALLDQIVSGADRQMANLSIQINSIDREVKSLLERFGFRLAGGSVMKRNHGSIRPPSVPATPGLSNR